jgi:alanine racemase
MRPTFLEVNLNQLKTNLQNIRAHTKTKIITMVKANAYGHGIDVSRRFSNHIQIILRSAGGGGDSLKKSWNQKTDTGCWWNFD